MNCQEDHMHIYTYMSSTADTCICIYIFVEKNDQNTDPRETQKRSRFWDLKGTEQYADTQTV